MLKHCVELACNCEAPAAAPQGPRALSALLSRTAQTPGSLGQMEPPRTGRLGGGEGGRVAAATDVRKGRRGSGQAELQKV